MRCKLQRERVDVSTHERAATRPVGIALLSFFFVFGALASGLAAFILMVKRLGSSHATPSGEGIGRFSEDKLNAGEKQPWIPAYFKPLASFDCIGCYTHFNRNKGYVDIRDSRILDHKHNWCRHHKEPKPIVAVRSGQPVWRCFHENCLSRTNLLGETITVGHIVLAAHPKHGRFKVWSIGEDGFAILQMVGNQGEGDSLMDFWEEIPIDRVSPSI